MLNESSNEKCTFEDMGKWGDGLWDCRREERDLGVIGLNRRKKRMYKESALEIKQNLISWRNKLSS